MSEICENVLSSDKVKKLTSYISQLFDEFPPLLEVAAGIAQILTLDQLVPLQVLLIFFTGSVDLMYNVGNPGKIEIVQPNHQPPFVMTLYLV